MARRSDPVAPDQGPPRGVLKRVPAGKQPLALELYRDMQRVRAVELAIESQHKRGHMHGSFHSSKGQEACAVGICSALEPEDMVTSTHRGHGHAVAKGVPIEGIFAELWGRSTGVSGGRGGSMHLHHRPSGFLGENAIVGAHLPIAVGCAWSAHIRGTGQVTVCFFGDGTTTIGAFHEALNLAALWDLPVVFVCENNLYSEYSRIDTV